MSENMESAVKRGLLENALLKKNQLIFFALNLLVMIPQIAARYSPRALAGTAVILLVLFWRTVCVPGVDVPASRDLPLLGFFDLCILLVLSYQELAGAFDPGGVLAVLERIGQKPHCLLLLLAGIGLSFLPVKDAAGVWCKGLAKTVMGAALLLFMWSTGVLTDLSFAPGGKAFFAFYLLCALLWYTLCAAAYCASPDSRSRNNGLSWLLLAMFFAVCLTEAGPVQAFASTRREWFLGIPDAGFQWWKVILAAVVLTGCAVAAYDYDYRRMGVDSLVLSAFAGGILLVRVLMSCYFAFSGVLLLALMAGSFQCLRNERNQRKTLRLTSPGYLLAQLAALLAAAGLLKRGLWVSVILLCVYGVIFYTTAGKRDSSKRQLAHWLTLLSCPMVLAVSYIWRMRFTLASCLFLAAAYAVFAFVICVLSWPHPSGQTCPNGYKWVICGLMALLCLIAAGRYGTEVQVVFQPEDNTASITLEAKGKENEIQSAVCRWSDVTGQVVSGEQVLSAGENAAPIQGEKLSIVVTDAFGAETTVTDWYPGWLLEVD